MPLARDPETVHRDRFTWSYTSPSDILSPEEWEAWPTTVVAIREISSTQCALCCGTHLLLAVLWQRARCCGTAPAVLIIRMMKGKWWRSGVSCCLVLRGGDEFQLLLPNPLMLQEVMTHLLETGSPNPPVTVPDGVIGARNRSAIRSHVPRVWLQNEFSLLFCPA